MAADRLLAHDVIDGLAHAEAARPGVGHAVIQALDDTEAARLWAAYRCEEEALTAANDVVKLALIHREFGPHEEDDDGP
jgi:hypothetical protein